MTVSEKQLKANRQNARKGGVKTAEGIAIAKYNALKHGLLAKEIVVDVGEGAESREEFDGLLLDLQAQLRPVGSLEEMLVEKIAVAYWRLRRAYRYEVGLIRDELDHVTDDFYGRTDWEGKQLKKTDEQINESIEEEREDLRSWRQDKKLLGKMRKAGKPLEGIYDWEIHWELLEEEVAHLLGPEDQRGFEPEELRERLEAEDWSDNEILQTLMEICDERIRQREETIADLNKQKEHNRLKLQVLQKLGSIPAKNELDRLLRYQGAIERQFYKAMNQLERLQRQRLGTTCPLPWWWMRTLHPARNAEKMGSFRSFCVQHQYLPKNLTFFVNISRFGFALYMGGERKGVYAYMVTNGTEWI